MQLQITFDTADNRNAFAAKTGYAAADQVTLEAHASLYQMAKTATGFVSASHLGDAGQAIVKAASTDGLDVVQALGEGFYLVNTADYVALSESGLESVEPAEVPVKLLSELTGTDVTDPTSAEAQWARIRVSVRYRPFGTEFVLSDSTPYRKPELIVVDSGINFTHPEFAGLETEDFYKLPASTTFADTNGHGTAIASAMSGVNLGVSRHVKLVNCKIFDTEKPTLIELGQAMDAILARHVADTATARVVNMSWCVPKSSYLEGKIQALVDAGMIVVAAAGNQGIDVAGLTPAGMASVITVGATDKDDVAAGFNDFAAADAAITTSSGQFLDIFAPGVDVVVAKWTGGYFKTSGTSVSAAFVSGCVSTLLGLIPTWPQTVSTVIEALVADSTTGVLLLDPAKFSENQNRMVHLATGELSGRAGFDYYLGAFGQDVSIIEGDTKKLFNIYSFDGEPITYEAVWEDAAMEADFGPFLSLNASTGEFVITKPTVELPSDTTLKLVRFKVRLSTAAVSRMTNGLIFFHVNPAYDGDASTDVASALEDLNSQSFFAAWSPRVFIK